MPKLRLTGTHLKPFPTGVEGTIQTLSIVCALRIFDTLLSLHFNLQIQLIIVGYMYGAQNLSEPNLGNWEAADIGLGTLGLSQHEQASLDH